MITKLNNQAFDTAIEPSDWRYAAAIVGLNKYLIYIDAEYDMSDEALLFNSDDITEEKYLSFVEYYYDDLLPHKELERKLNQTKFEEEEIKHINKLLKINNQVFGEKEFKGKNADELLKLIDANRELLKKGPTQQYTELENKLNQDKFTNEDKDYINELLKTDSVLKKIFGEKEFNGENANYLKDLIKANRERLIKINFYKNIYTNYIGFDPRRKEAFIKFLEEGKTVCRLLGYHVDESRKLHALSFNFDSKTFVAQDSKLFDFIPFAFQGDFIPFAFQGDLSGRINSETFFINNNYNLQSLIDTNTVFEAQIMLFNNLKKEDLKKVSSRKILFDAILASTDFLDHDVEVIKKNSNYEFFETMIIRKESSIILRKAKKNKTDFNALSRFIKINKNYFIDIQNEVINAILNLTILDSLIELCLKEEQQYLVVQLLKINTLIKKEGDTMNCKLKDARMKAQKVVRVLESSGREKKIKSYRDTMINCIVVKNYDRFCEILLQLSSYTGVYFDFVDVLFDDFESNKNVAYAFINDLIIKGDTSK